MYLLSLYYSLTTVFPHEQSEVTTGVVDGLVTDVGYLRLWVVLELSLGCCLALF